MSSKEQEIKEVHTEDAGFAGLPQGEMVLGELCGIDENGQPLVSFHLEYRHGPVAAIATIPVTPQHVGRQVGLLFAQNSQCTPVIVGLVHNAFHNILDSLEIAEANNDELLFESASTSADAPTVPATNIGELSVDGKKFVIEAQEEIVLRCGDSSISLHRNGKISIRGKYLLNRSSGVNRIMGGSVQVN